MNIYMDSLEEKFLSNHITKPELQQLRSNINTVSDETLEESIHKRWDDFDTAPKSFKVDVEKMWSRIEDRVKVSSVNHWKSAWKWMQIAAVIMMPVLLFSTYWFYAQRNDLFASVTTVCTQIGGKANVVLPDGTRVMLNEDSELSYNPGNFNNAKRQVSFNGEAVFQVAKDSIHPFSINATGLNVKVMGTTFNLFARKDMDVAELALQSGKVIFSSSVSDEKTIVLPNQIATLNKSTGGISVRTMAEGVQDATAWQRNELVFRNASLKHVIATIEKNYRVKFHFRIQPNMEDLFTGVLAANDLGENLKILEKSYHVKLELNDNIITIRR